MKHNWEYKQLGEVCSILDSLRKPVTKSDRKSGPYPYYGASGVQDYVSDYIFDGDFLLVGEDGAKWGANDKTAFSISGKSWVNNHAHILDFKDSPVSQKLVEYVLCSRDLNKIITGAVVPKLTQKNLAAISIPVPPMEVQEKIVAELDKINEVIEDCRELLRNLDTLAQSLFYDYFGDPVTNPKGWEMQPLKMLVKDKLAYGSGASGIPFNNNIRYIRITDIDEFGQLKPEIASSPSEYDSKYDLKDGDVLFARSGATVGKTFLYKDSIGKAIYAGYLIKATVNQTLIIPTYLYALTKTAYYLDYISSSIRGAAQPNVNAQQYGSFAVPLPPLALQEQFAARIEQIEAQKRNAEETIATMQTLLDSRMDHWFN